MPLDPLTFPVCVYTAYRVVRWTSWLGFCIWATRHSSVDAPVDAPKVIRAARQSITVRLPRPKDTS